MDLRRWRHRGAGTVVPIGTGGRWRTGGHRGMARLAGDEGEEGDGGVLVVGKMDMPEKMTAVAAVLGHRVTKAVAAMDGRRATEAAWVQAAVAQFIRYDTGVAQGCHDVVAEDPRGGMMNGSPETREASWVVTDGGEASGVGMMSGSPYGCRRAAAMEGHCTVAGKAAEGPQTGEEEERRRAFISSEKMEEGLHLGGEDGG